MKKWVMGLLSAIVLLTLLAVTAMVLKNRFRMLPARQAQSDAARPDALTRFRTEREQLRQRRRAELNDIIHDARTDADTLALAQRQFVAQLEAEDAEVRLEGLLGARGFEGAVVSVSEGAVNVLVRRESMTRQETALILDLVLRETGVSGGNVKIIPVY